MTKCIMIMIFSVFLGSLGVAFIMPEDMKHSDWVESHRWEHRLVVISGDEESVIKQRDLFLQLEEGVLDRDIVVLTIIHPPTAENQDPAIPDPDSLAADLGITSSDFQIVLVGKDGRVKEHRFERIDPMDWFDCIDAMPMRLQEMKHRNKA
ncbi:MAG: hypothetical protein CMJ29_03095 [Phycisphaerae bacterium]|nr:hypothetical protein [Phycisphaerae bacterium]|tara:strand:+ start:92 stop:544 length:453 start_codon:yes stop_codon:yes gene_type:complete